jgi:hypothetical protein
LNVSTNNASLSLSSIGTTTLIFSLPSRPNPLFPMIFAPIPSVPPLPTHGLFEMKMLLPACNSFQDSAQGCLFGIPPEFFGGSRRACLDVLQILFLHLQPHFASTNFGELISADFFSFIKYYGLRPSYLNGSFNPKARVFFFCLFPTGA